MSEDKKDIKGEKNKDEKAVEKTAGDSAIKKEKKAVLVKDEKVVDDKIDEPKKDSLGLEELPEEVRKKLEKKKAERDQKSKKGKVKKKKKKARINVPSGRAYIKATYNNTIVSLTDLQGNIIAWASAGVAGFRGPKKSTPYAAAIITRLAVGKAREEYGLKEVAVFVKGVGTGRESAIRALNSNGLLVKNIKDVTPIPHNGCRAKKPRRV